MKKVILIICLLSNLSYLNSQNIKREFDFAPYMSEISTVSFEVLDINIDKKLVAFKHVFNLLPIEYYSDGTSEIPCSCNYPGMQDNPNAGVVLGVYDLENNKFLKTFLIYKPVYDKKDCFDYQTSAKNLDSAKIYFAENKLDITKKPKPYFFSKNEDENKCELNYSGIMFYSTSEKNYDDMKTFSYLFANGKNILTIEQDDFYVMASGGNIEYIAAYVLGDKIVFLNKFVFVSHLEGATGREFYDFTPIYSINNLK
jgi:hypothetical protein